HDSFAHLFTAFPSGRLHLTNQDACLRTTTECPIHFDVTEANFLIEFTFRQCPSSNLISPREVTKPHELHAGAHFIHSSGAIISVNNPLCCEEFRSKTCSQHHLRCLRVTTDPSS